MRKFKTANYEATLQETVTIEECLPPNHLARFIVETIKQLELSKFYARYAETGGEAYAPEILLGLLIYGYATGMFSTRKIERATYEVIPFRYIAGGYHPDHDTIATFRKTFLVEFKDVFVQVLMIAAEAGVLKLGNVSIDGSKVHADASKSQAVSWKRLAELEVKLQKEVEDLVALSESGEVLPAELSIADEIAFRQDRLVNLAQAKVVLEARAEARYQEEMAEYEAKMREREEKARKKGSKPRGRKPKPPTPGARDKDQYNFTDPDSRIMKNSTNKGFDQHYNVQVAVDQASYLIIANTLSNHPTDRNEAIPTLDAIAPALGKPPAAALDNGYFSPDTIAQMEARHIEAYIATGRDPHHRNWRTYFMEQPTPPSEEASAVVKMAYKLRTAVGKAIYRLRKCTVEPVIGIIKEVMGFRQFSLRGECAASGEWGLVCLAFNLKRLHTLMS